MCLQIRLLRLIICKYTTDFQIIKEKFTLVCYFVFLQ